MSYVRFSESSGLYIYPAGDALVCHACHFEGHGLANYVTGSRAEMLAHVARHREAGHTVPESVDERLRAEIEEYGDDAARGWFSENLDDEATP